MRFVGGTSQHCYKPILYYYKIIRIICVMCCFDSLCISLLFQLSLQRGGTAGFLQMFLHESSNIVVEMVMAFGGNAVVNFKLNECVLMDSPSKHQVRRLHLYM